MVHLSALALPLLQLLEPEMAHRLTLAALKTVPFRPGCPQKQRQDAATKAPSLEARVLGLSFVNPFGIAAGFDKNAEVFDPLLRLGFGHVEVGGVTPRPQAGNPRPRVFRLPKDGAVINRLGFNNDGLDVMCQRLSRRTEAGIVGVNLGSNKETIDRAADFIALLQGLTPWADYFTINVSSPNTPGLRDLQGEAALDLLLGRIMEARAALCAQNQPQRPVLLKIAPDITLSDLDSICAVVLKHALDGLVVSNTLVARPNLLEAALATQTGGLSGRPLFARSTALLGAAFQRVGDKIPLIGVGGVENGQTAVDKIRAGASLVQLYTGLIYRGIPLLDEMISTLTMTLHAQKMRSVADLVGSDAAHWAAQA